MARYAYKLPDIGEGIAEAEIVKWHAAPGTELAQDQPLVDVMTDKATVEISAPVAGRLQECHGREGERLAIGAVLAVFETDQAIGPAAPAQSPPELRGTGFPPAPSPAHKNKLAAPAVRARAAKLGIELASVSGSGPEGRILHEDLDRLLLSRSQTGGTPLEDRPEDVEEIKVFGLRRRIAERMQDSKRRIPHFTYVEEVEVDAVEASRARLNAGGNGAQVSLLSFFVRALVRAIARHPEVNAHYKDMEGVILRFKAVHVGIATQTDRGLLVPVIRNAQDCSLETISSEIQRLSSAARAGKSDPRDITGSTITVTSLGRLGGVMATPIINPPELAIIGLNRIRDSLILTDGQLKARKVMNLSSSFDHRIIDGFVAASFIATLCEEIRSGLPGEMPSP